MSRTRFLGRRLVHPSVLGGLPSSRRAVGSAPGHPGLQTRSLLALCMSSGRPAADLPKGQRLLGWALWPPGLRGGFGFGASLLCDWLFDFSEPSSLRMLQKGMMVLLWGMLWQPWYGCLWPGALSAGGMQTSSEGPHGTPPSEGLRESSTPFPQCFRQRD